MRLFTSSVIETQRNTGIDILDYILLLGNELFYFDPHFVKPRATQEELNQCPAAVSCLFPKSRCYYGTLV